MELQSLKKIALVFILEDDGDEELLEELAATSAAVNHPRGPNRLHGVRNYVEETVPRYTLDDFRVLYHMSRNNFEVIFFLNPLKTF